MQTQKKLFTTRSLVLGALCLALAFILSYVKLWEMPQGGSVTLLSMLPIFLYAYLFGTVPGLIVSLAYSILQFIQAPYFIAVPQFLLDYTLGFTVLGLTGLFKTKNAKDIIAFPVACAVCGLLRTLCSFISGMIYYAEYAAPGQPVWLYSFGYNFPSLGTDTLLCVVGAVALVGAGLLIRLKKMAANQ